MRFKLADITTNTKNAKASWKTPFLEQSQGKMGKCWLFPMIYTGTEEKDSTCTGLSAVDHSITQWTGKYRKERDIQSVLGIHGG